MFCFCFFAIMPPFRFHSGAFAFFRLYARLSRLLPSFIAARHILPALFSSRRCLLLMPPMMILRHACHSHAMLYFRHDAAGYVATCEFLSLRLITPHYADVDTLRDISTCRLRRRLMPHYIAMIDYHISPRHEPFRCCHILLDYAAADSCFMLMPFSLPLAMPPQPLIAASPPIRLLIAIRHYAAIFSPLIDIAAFFDYRCRHAIATCAITLIRQR